VTTSRTRSFVLPALLALLALVGACNRRAAPPAPAAPSAPRTAADVLPATDPRALRMHRVDMLVAQWDVAQSGGRLDQADQLGRQIQGEVDGAFQDFAAASRGQMGTPFQYVAVSALGFSQRREATGLLVDRLGDPDTALVGNALIALKIRSDPETPLAPILKLVASRAPSPRRFAPLAIANVVDARYRTGRNLDPEMQKAATHVLSGVVADRDPLVRLHVAKALGALRTPACFELLMILMRDDQIRVRIAAAAGLERMGDPRGFPETIRLLADAPEDAQGVVRDILASYAERLQGRALTSAELAGLGTSPTSWSRWFGEYARQRGLPLDEGRAPGAPPGAARSGAPGTPPPPAPVDRGPSSPVPRTPPPPTPGPLPPPPVVR